VSYEKRANAYYVLLLDARKILDFQKFDTFDLSIQNTNECCMSSFSTLIYLDLLCL